MALSSIPSGFALFDFAANAALLWVIAVSVAIGFAMVVTFRYTSDQKAIARAKDRLKAHLLAVRLFQDQLPVVMRAYGKILHGTGSYLRLAFTPFLIAILPITFLIVQLDRYFGWLPLRPAETFLVEARVDDPAELNGASLQLPAELSSPLQPSMFRKTKRWCGAWWRGVKGDTIYTSPWAARRFRSKSSYLPDWPAFRPCAYEIISGSACLPRANRHWPTTVRCNRSPSAIHRA